MPRHDCSVPLVSDNICVGPQVRELVHSTIKILSHKNTHLSLYLSFLVSCVNYIFKFFLIPVTKTTIFMGRGEYLVNFLRRREKDGTRTGYS